MRKEIIETVRNIKSGKLFVLLDDSHGVAFKLVNPAGQIVNLPANLFESETIIVTAGEPDSELTAEQMTTVGDFNARAKFRIGFVNRMREQTRQKRTARRALHKLRGARQHAEDDARKSGIRNFSGCDVNKKFRATPEVTGDG